MVKAVNWQWLYSDEQEDEPEWVTELFEKWPNIGGAKHELNPKKGGPVIKYKGKDGDRVLHPGDWLIKLGDQISTATAAESQTSSSGYVSGQGSQMGNRHGLDQG